MEYHPPLHLGVVAIEKGAFESPSTKITNFTYSYIYEAFLYLFLKLKKDKNEFLPILIL